MSTRLVGSPRSAPLARAAARVAFIGRRRSRRAAVPVAHPATSPEWRATPRSAGFGLLLVVLADCEGGEHGLESRVALASDAAVHVPAPLRQHGQGPEMLPVRRPRAEFAPGQHLEDLAVLALPADVNAVGGIGELPVVRHGFVEVAAVGSVVAVVCDCHLPISSWKGAPETARRGRFYRLRRPWRGRRAGSRSSGVGNRAGGGGA